MEIQNLSIYIPNPKPRNQKNFIYHNKEYPVNFELLKENCGYFYKNRKQFKEVNDICLLNEDEEVITLTEESIVSFIKICQNEECQITFSSILPLQYLSYKYDFQALKTIPMNLLSSMPKNFFFKNFY